MFSRVEGGKVPRSEGVVKGSGYALPPTQFTPWFTKTIQPRIILEQRRKPNVHHLSNSESKLYLVVDYTLFQGKGGGTMAISMETNFRKAIKDILSHLVMKKKNM